MEKKIERIIRFTDNYTEVSLYFVDDKLQEIDIYHFGKQPNTTITIAQPALFTALRNSVNAAYNYITNEEGIKI